jgi:hypothetical protein
LPDNLEAKFVAEDFYTALQEIFLSLGTSGHLKSGQQRMPGFLKRKFFQI